MNVSSCRPHFEISKARVNLVNVSSCRTHFEISKARVFILCDFHNWVITKTTFMKKQKSRDPCLLGHPVYFVLSKRFEILKFHVKQVQRGWECGHYKNRWPTFYISLQWFSISKDFLVNLKIYCLQEILAFSH